MHRCTFKHACRTVELLHFQHLVSQQLVHHVLVSLFQPVITIWCTSPVACSTLGGSLHYCAECARPARYTACDAAGTDSFGGRHACSDGSIIYCSANAALPLPVIGGFCLPTCTAPSPPTFARCYPGLQFPLNFSFEEGPKYCVPEYANPYADVAAISGTSRCFGCDASSPPNYRRYPVPTPPQGEPALCAVVADYASSTVYEGYPRLLGCEVFRFVIYIGRPM